MGTVMLKNDTKIKLTKVAADLQKKLGIRVDFDTAISFLIEQYLKQNQNWDKFDEFIKPVKNVTKKELLEELYRGRNEDEKK